MSSTAVYDIVVIGGGAAGMMAAISSARTNSRLSVAIIEHKDQLGQKILSTGNGHCNYTNMQMDASFFHSQTNPKFVEEALSIFGTSQTLDFFCELGIEPFEKNGYYYPYSMQAKSIRDVLLFEIRRLGIDVYTNETINAISYADRYRINTTTGEYVADNLIIAAGGRSYPKSGSDGSLYPLINKLSEQIRFTKQRPALTSLKTDFEYIKRISGVRAYASVTLNGQSQTGEVQFGDDCISGIVVFNLSDEVNRQDNKSSLFTDFFPALSKEELLSRLTLRFNCYGRHKNAKEAMVGLLPDKLCEVALSLARIPATTVIGSDIATDDIKKLADILKAMEFSVYPSTDYSRAQITGGGIDISGLSLAKPDAFELPGLYFAGEIMDVQGQCGGYNLQWAWTSGYLMGKAAAERSKVC